MDCLRGLSVLELLGLLALFDLVVKLNRWAFRLVRFAYRAVHQWMRK